MPEPADTIREALNYPKRPHKGMTLQALAALTELEQRLALEVDVARVERRRVEAAEADRDRLRESARVIAEELDRMNGAYQRKCDEAQTLRDALEQIALHDGGGENGSLCQHRMAGDKHPNCRPVITRLARAALATPNTPPGA